MEIAESFFNLLNSCLKVAKLLYNISMENTIHIKMSRTAGLLIGCMLFIIFLNGCALSLENSRVVMGISEKALYGARANAKTQIVELDYQACYKKVIRILKKMKAYIYLHSLEKQRIVAMNFKDTNNTTQVGIFFSQVTPNSTKVEISCLSHYVLENVSEKLFSALKDKNL